MVSSISSSGDGRVVMVTVVMEGDRVMVVVVKISGDTTGRGQ